MKDPFVARRSLSAAGTKADSRVRRLCVCGSRREVHGRKGSGWTEGKSMAGREVDAEGKSMDGREVDGRKGSAKGKCKREVRKGSGWTEGKCKREVRNGSAKDKCEREVDGRKGG